MDSVRTMKLCGWHLFPVRDWRPLGATMVLTCTFRAACLDEKFTCMLTAQIRNWCQPLFHVGDDFQNNSNAYHSRSMMEYDVHYGCSERQSDIPATHKEAADTYVPHTGQVREVYQPLIYIYCVRCISFLNRGAPACQDLFVHACSERKSGFHFHLSAWPRLFDGLNPECRVQGKVRVKSYQLSQNGGCAVGGFYVPSIYSHAICDLL